MGPISAGAIRSRRTAHACTVPHVSPHFGLALAELAAQGVAMLLISSEMEEVMGMSHRVGVMHEGRLEGILDADEVTPEALIRLATGGRVE